MTENNPTAEPNTEAIARALVVSVNSSGGVRYVAGGSIVARRADLTEIGRLAWQAANMLGMPLTGVVTEEPATAAKITEIYPDLFVEHSNFMWRIWKGEERGVVGITTASCGKSFGTKHPFRSGAVPAFIEDRLLAANAEQFGMKQDNPSATGTK